MNSQSRALEIGTIIRNRQRWALYNDLRTQTQSIDNRNPTTQYQTHLNSQQLHSEHQLSSTCLPIIDVLNWNLECEQPSRFLTTVMSVIAELHTKQQENVSSFVTRATLKTFDIIYNTPSAAKACCLILRKLFELDSQIDAWQQIGEVCKLLQRGLGILDPDLIELLIQFSQRRATMPPHEMVQILANRPLGQQVSESELSRIIDFLSNYVNLAAAQMTPSLEMDYVGWIERQLCSSFVVPLLKVKLIQLAESLIANCRTESLFPLLTQRSLIPEIILRAKHGIALHHMTSISCLNRLIQRSSHQQRIYYALNTELTEAFLLNLQAFPNPMLQRTVCSLKQINDSSPRCRQAMLTQGLLSSLRELRASDNLTLHKLGEELLLEFLKNDAL